MIAPLAHSGGSSLDEFLVQIGLILSVVLAVKGWSGRRRPEPVRRRAGWLLLVVAAPLTAAATLTLPARYLRTPIAKVRPASTATLAILEPASGATIPRPVLELAVEMRGGRIVERTSRTLRPDEGHLHVSIDGNVVAGSVPARSRIDIGRATPGRHLLQVEYVALDHGPFSPRVLATTSFFAE